MTLGLSNSMPNNTLYYFPVHLFEVKVWSEPTYDFDMPNSIQFLSDIQSLFGSV